MKPNSTPNALPNTDSEHESLKPGITSVPTATNQQTPLITSSRSAGGLTVAGNLIPACRRCNGAKSSADWRDWFAAQSWHCPDRALRIDGWLGSAQQQEAA
jgi:hypothetical protein